MSKENIVKRTIDLTKPPVLTAEQKARLNRLAAMSDDQIDYSDIPPMPEDAVWVRAVDVASKNKQQITLRLDADVLAFFREAGNRYQSRINAVLRSYMNAHKAQ